MAVSKSIIKSTYPTPSAETLARISASDKVAALHAASFRYEAQLAEIERQFETKVSHLRESYLDEVLEIHNRV
jgi:hypothetical protein